MDLPLRGTDKAQGSVQLRLQLLRFDSRAAREEDGLLDAMTADSIDLPSQGVQVGVRVKGVGWGVRGWGGCFWTNLLSCLLRGWRMRTGCGECNGWAARAIAGAGGPGCRQPGWQRP